MSFRIKDMKVAAKMGYGFGAVLLLLLISNVIGLNGFRNVTDHVDKGHDAQLITQKILQLQRVEKDFMLNNSTETVEEFKVLMDSVLLISDIALDKHAEQTVIEDKKEIIKHIEEYNKSFHQFVAVDSSMRTNMQEMRNAGYVVLDNLHMLQVKQEQQLKSNVASNAEEEMILNYVNNSYLISQIIEAFLEARKGEKDIYIFNETKYYEKHDKKYAFINENIKLLNRGLTFREDLNLLKTVKESLVVYNENYEAFALSMKEKVDIAQRLAEDAEHIFKLSTNAGEFQSALMFNEMRLSRRELLLMTIVAFILVALVANYITRSITIPIKKGVEFASLMSRGHLNSRLNIDQKDEVGQLARALNVMSDNVKDIITTVVSSAGNLAAASQQINSTSQELSQGATEQATSVEEVSSTMEEITSMIKQNNRNAQNTSAISKNAYAGIVSVNDKSNEAIEANKQIAEKIGIINDIAFQTNILALNAAVEAARAGEQGKGFAVVANEVRKLAESSKMAADEIVRISQNGLNLTLQSGEQLNELLPEIEKTTNLVSEISGASDEQSSGSVQINNAIQQLNIVTQQNAASSEELAASAEEMNSQAEQLKELVGFFKIDALSN